MVKALAAVALLSFAPVAVAEPANLRYRPTIVRDTSHLVRATQTDPEVNAMARALASRRNASTAFTVVSLVAGVGLAAYGLGSSSDGPRMGFVWGGATIAAIGQFLAWGGAPRRADYDAVEDKWNERHPEQPIDVR